MARIKRRRPADPGDWTRNLADFDTEADYLAALADWQEARDLASPLERDAAERARIADEIAAANQPDDPEPAIGEHGPEIVIPGGDR